MGDEDLRRRSVLTYLGATGASVSLAGCNLGENGTNSTDSQPNGTNGNGTDSGTSPEPSTESLTLLHDTHVGGRLGNTDADDNENIERSCVAHC
jgi:2',3'-cyclic-nucleotide 2'-phosphodiesterase/3'-nucleotidase